tara:strand:+ start:929 stop:1360 length:432 start_codon:yes stop_codon:yes gene_type:complete
MSFNVVISSSDKIASSSIRNAEYYFDWNNFRGDNSSYELTFTYCSEPESQALNNKVLQISLPDLPQLNFRTSSEIGANTSGIIGIVFPEVHHSKEYYSAKPSDNPPVYVDSLPFQSNFKVDLVSDSAINAPPSYKLILSFKKI